MTQRPSSIPPAGRARGFTLIELLVVIGIIILLISILLPVAGRVKIQAQSAKTQATMASIASAIERYYQDEHSYPGLFSNDQLQRQGTAPASATFTLNFKGNTGGTQLTQTENMVAALVGGIDPDTTGAPKVVDLSANPSSIGKGAVNFASLAQYRARRAPYIDALPGALLPELPYSTNGCARNSIEMIGAKAVALGTTDTSFPEFYDDYGTRRPIIYMRANVGTTTICSKLNDPKGGPFTQQISAQYMAYELNFYRRGLAGDFPGDFQFGTTTGDYEFFPGAANDPTQYLSHPSIANSPRNKDKFILISAGPDRCFGTKDDIFYGGN